ncbi:metallophosphoesterase family protein, partial [Clostridium sporogenes]
GHTHIPLAEKTNNIFMINPGSITFPKENTPHCYGILNDNLFKIKTLEGDIFKEISLI